MLVRLDHVRRRVTCAAGRGAQKSEGDGQLRRAFVGPRPTPAGWAWVPEQDTPSRGDPHRHPGALDLRARIARAPAKSGKQRFPSACRAKNARAPRISPSCRGRGAYLPHTRQRNTRAASRGAVKPSDQATPPLLHAQRSAASARGEGFFQLTCTNARLEFSPAACCGGEATSKACGSRRPDSALAERTSGNRVNA